MGPSRLDDIEDFARSGTPISSRAGEQIDPSYLSPYKQGSRPGLSESRSASEPDSLLDLYRHPKNSTERSFREGPDKGEYKEMTDPDMYLDEDDPERSRWIHRDKLLVIENQEMQAAGFVPPQPRPSSRSKAKRETSQDLYANGARGHDTEEMTTKEGKRRRVRSPPRQEEVGEENFVNDFDLRTPEEIAADSYMEQSSSPVYRQQQRLRSSSSRIPLPRSSPMPIPQEHIERNTPLPRKRGASGNWSGGDEDGISYNRLRSRGNSVGSQVLLDDIDAPHQTPTPAADSRPTSQDSPIRTRNPNTYKSLPSRKNPTATPNSQSKPRSTSTAATRSPSTPLQRPKSRGLETRPPTAINRPEGDPPWLATMYKPDPRLPPDQQILPTHAKRIQQERQEQWDKAQQESARRQQQQQQQQRMEHDGEEAGKDEEQAPEPLTEFTPLAVHTRNGLQPPPSRDGPLQEPNPQALEWPLTRATPRPALAAAAAGLGSGSSPEKGNAGYSTIPRVRSQDTYNASVVSGTRGGEKEASAKGMDPFERERLARLGDEEKGEREKGARSKGCGCCIVM